MYSNFKKSKVKICCSYKFKQKKKSFENIYIYYAMLEGHVPFNIRKYAYILTYNIDF